MPAGPSALPAVRAFGAGRHDAEDDAAVGHGARTGSAGAIAGTFPRGATWRGARDSPDTDNASSGRRRPQRNTARRPLAPDNIAASVKTNTDRNG